MNEYKIRITLDGWQIVIPRLYELREQFINYFVIEEETTNEQTGVITFDLLFESEDLWEARDYLDEYLLSELDQEVIEVTKPEWVK